MKELKIVHSADIHFDRENQESALKSLNYLYEYGENQGVDLWVIAGDLFNRAVQNTESSGFPDLVRVMQKIMNIAPVVAVRGTPTHDIQGCYDALQEINAEYGFTLISPHADCYFLGDDGAIYADIWSAKEPIEGRKAELLILGCPEPSKEWFLRDKRMGREEANQAVIDGMKGMLLGWAAIRKQYPDIPCLFVYHGNIVGATLQNNQILPPGDIAIGRDDLALVGADYYALGHIHLAQQIGEFPAYYAGSAFPCNWGETDQKSFNSVIFGASELPESGSFVKCEFISFPHPPRKKITQPFGNNLPEDVSGFQVWLEIKAEKGQAAVINKESVLLELEGNGALPGSRVTVSVLLTETVRAGHIQEASKLRDKVQIYSDNSGESVSKSILLKADKLEAEAQAEGLGEGLHIDLKKLVLRGAVGIWKGQGKDEIELDLSNYDPGLIALVDINGAGKTTLIENMHPFPEMLTRQGKLQDHFRLRDSFRDLYFMDERTGDQYRAFVQIDGQNASGKCEYHLYKNGQPLSNGRKEEYVEQIAQLFGSMSLFLRSAFVSQKPSKNNPDLSEATKGEKKALFRELGGLEYLQAYSKSSKGEADNLETEINRDTGKIETLSTLIASLPEKEEEKKVIAGNITIEKTSLSAIEEKGKALKTEAEALEKKVADNREIQNRCNELRSQLEKLGKEEAEIDARLKEYNSALQNKEGAEKSIAEYEQLKEREGKLNEEKHGILTKREWLSTEYQDKKDIVADQEKELLAKETQIQQEIAKIDTKKGEFVGKIDQIEEFLAKKIECPKCGHTFAHNEVELKANLETYQQTVYEADQDLVELDKESELITKQIAAIVWPEEPDLPPLETIDEKLSTLKQDLAFLDVDTARAQLQKAQEAQVRTEEGEKRLSQIEADHTRLKGELAAAEDRIDTEIENQHREIVQKLDAARAEYEKLNNTVIHLEADLRNLETQITDLKERSEELKQLQATIKEKQQEISEWRYTERACGPDGIQALELDAMGPGIAEVANRLLQAAYGARFQIEFRTTRIGGQGSKKKQIEDFQIVVFDSEGGTEQMLETLSGGESVWIKRAIYDAFGIIRDRNTGQRFLTAFQDECDGALDPDAKIAYFQMLEAAHKESGRHHTIVITHSQEAQEMIAQKIEMADLHANMKEAVA